jgi:hypothetical protein
MSASHSQSWISVDNLPAGKYTIEAHHNFSTKETGNMPFAVLTFGQTEKLALA